jgi:ComF family protein
MAAHMCETLRIWSPPVDAIVPVPLHGSRRRSRGYNQSELLARELAHLSGLPLERDVLRRVRNTRPQTEQPDAASRRLNVAGAFGPGKAPPSGSILLIDDVTTTGSTLEACARVLLANGAAHVYALTFAREDFQTRSQ